VVNRLQKVLEWANIKLAAVVSDINGVSARRILKALIEGVQDSQHLADLTHGSLQHKREQLEQALSGRVREHHRFLIASHLSHLEFLEAQIASFDVRIAQHLETQPPLKPPESSAGSESEPSSSTFPSTTNPQSLSWEQAVQLLDTIPGVARRTAELLLAEIGLDMSRFPSAAHLAKWARLCPGNCESAGKRLSGSIGQGNNWLRSALVQAAHAAVKRQGTYLAAVYRRLAARRGKLKAIVAVAHRILIAAYHILRKQQPYQDLGANYLPEHRQERVLSRLCRQFQQLGYQVSLQPTA
jgi:transposase